jgi:hypothetical protein
MTMCTLDALGNQPPPRWRACLAAPFAALLLAAAFLLAPVAPAAAGLEGFKECWEAIKSGKDLPDDLAAAAKHLDAKCAENYENPVFWVVTGALVAAKRAGKDCNDANAEQFIAGLIVAALKEGGISVDEDLQKAATGAGHKKLREIPVLNFFPCACDLAHADEDVQKLLESAHKTWDHTKNCGKALGTALLSIPGLVLDGLGLGFIGDLFKAGACSNAVSEGIYEGLGGECDDGPSPEEIAKDNMNNNVETICHDPGLDNDEIAELEKIGGSAFGEKCRKERDDAIKEQNALLCRGSGGQWLDLQQVAFCQCPPGKSHGVWCEPQPCPPPWTPPPIK